MIAYGQCTSLLKFSALITMLLIICRLNNQFILADRTSVNLIFARIQSAPSRNIYYIYNESRWENLILYSYLKIFIGICEINFKMLKIASHVYCAGLKFNNFHFPFNGIKKNHISTDFEPNILQFQFNCYLQK